MFLYRKKKVVEKNILDIIDERLNKLKVEKQEIEKNFGISEEKLQKRGKSKQDNTPMIHNKELKHLQTKHKYENLPSLEIKIKKEEKSNYKTPDVHTDSLKYEPNIDDLYDKNEFEAKFFTLESLKCQPSISRIDDNLISSYYEYTKEKFIDKNFK